MLLFIVQDFSIWACIFNLLLSLIGSEISSSAISFVQKSKTSYLFHAVTTKNEVKLWFVCDIFVMFYNIEL